MTLLGFSKPYHAKLVYNLLGEDLLDVCSNMLICLIAALLQPDVMTAKNTSLDNTFVRFADETFKFLEGIITAQGPPRRSDRLVGWPLADW